jgi:uncharacterized membrane protein
MNRKGLIILVTLAATLLLSSSAVAQQEGSTQRINEIQLQENGDAVWIVEIREPLEDETEVSNFETYVEQVNNSTNSETTQTFQNRFSAVISGADQQYERNMSLESLSVEAEVANTATGDFGITRVQFTWTNYLTTNGSENIVIGQILSDGYTLSENQILRVVPPQGYKSQSTPAGAEPTDDGVLEWVGPYSFSDSVEITFEETSPREIPVVPMAIVVVVALGIVGVATYYLSENDSLNGSQENNPGGGSSNNTTSSWSTNELRTEDEKVVELLEENGGRVKQKELKSILDWSDSKASRVTSNLEEKEVIEKLTIGRENIIRLED